MLKTGILQDIDEIIGGLLDPQNGYAVIKNFISDSDADRYREECIAMLARCPRIYTRLIGDRVPDYAQPIVRLPDGRVRRPFGPFGNANTIRLYQFPGNRHSAETEQMFSTIVDLRNRIEQQWIDDVDYHSEREAVLDYHQATTMLDENAGITRHRDYNGKELQHPLLQTFLLISQPGTDFEGGELVLYPREGNPVRTHQHLGLSKGDLLIFDKSLEHEVEPSKRLNDIGRWSVVIGARSRPQGRWIHRFRFGALNIERMRPAMRRIQRRFGKQAVQ